MQPISKPTHIRITLLCALPRRIRAAARRRIRQHAERGAVGRRQTQRWFRCVRVRRHRAQRASPRVARRPNASSPRTRSSTRRRRCWRRFGPDGRFSTGLWTDGTVNGGVVTGDVYLRGGGDPLFGSADYVGKYFGSRATVEQLALRLRTTGVTEITGRVIRRRRRLRLQARHRQVRLQRQLGDRWRAQWSGFQQGPAQRPLPFRPGSATPPNDCARRFAAPVFWSARGSPRVERRRTRPAWHSSLRCRWRRSCGR